MEERTSYCYLELVVALHYVSQINESAHKLDERQSLDLPDLTGNS